MSSHCFSEIFLHFNWHCLNNAPMITPEREKQIHDFFRSYCAETEGVYYIASNGTLDHIHLLAQIEPTVLVSNFVGKIKGASSHEMNERLGPNTLRWQRGYGVVSFARMNLPGLLGYVQNQKAHHQKGSTRLTLEKYDTEMETEMAEAGEKAR